MTTEAIHITTPVDVDTAFSWDELYSRYAPVMYGYILKRLKNKAAADEVFSTAFVSLKDYVADIAAAKSITIWFIKFAMQHCIDYEFRSKTFYNTDQKSKAIQQEGQQWILAHKSSVK